MRSLAAAPSLHDALVFLAATSYGHGIHADLDVGGAQRVIAETSLWHLRVLAGWLPPSGLQSLRVIAGWFELHNLESQAVGILAGERWRESPLPLGVLATVWPRAAAASTLEQLRAVLARSTWGQPREATFSALLLALRIGWARAIRTVLPEARAWGDAGVVLALAKALFGAGNKTSVPMLAVSGLDRTWRNAAGLGEFSRAVPLSARWVLSGVQVPSDLWKAELNWWTRVHHDGTALLGRAQHGRTTVMAAATLLLADCWRTQAALEKAARGPGRGGHAHADA